MLTDAGVASASNCWARLESLLHHRADKARELGNVAGEQLLSELEVAENTLQRVRVPVIGRSRKKLSSHIGPMLYVGDAEVLLGLEVVEEGALGDIARRAQVIHRRRRIALGANDLQRHVENLRFGRGFMGSLRHDQPPLLGIIMLTRWYAIGRRGCRRCHLPR